MENLIRCELCENIIDLDQSDSCDKCGKSIFLSPEEHNQENIRSEDKTLMETLLKNEFFQNRETIENIIEFNFRVNDLIKKCDPDAKILLGMNEAIVGKTTDGRLVYDSDKILYLLNNKYGFPLTSLDEFLNTEIYNITEGKLSPIFISLDFELIKLSL
jgi:hypothetical protein